MRAAVIQKFGEVPRYAEFRDPIVTEGNTLLKVKAAALENFDKLTAAGNHYASNHMFPAFPAVVGHSGVGELEDGTLVWFAAKGPYGAMAEVAIVPKEYKPYMKPVPAGVDPALAAALPAAALTSLLPLKYGEHLQPGDTVLINGATGVSGKLALQMTKLLGAGKIVATGRDAESLRQAINLGADVTIDTRLSDDELEQAFLKELGKGYDIVLDYLWGRPTELLLQALVPKQAGFATHKTRLVQIGAAAGPTITLAAEQLRTSGVRLSGASDISPDALSEATRQVWDWMKEKKLSMDIEEVPLQDVAHAWERKTEGKRIVLVLP